MKKWIVSIIAACSLLISGVAIGESINGSFNGNPIVKVQSGGKIITDEVPAQIIDGKTMVPLTMLRSLGFDVNWNPNDYSVSVSQKKVLTKDEIANIAKQAVGEIYEYDASGKLIGQGSGVIISPDGWMITNHHVMAKASSATFQVNGSTYTFSKGDFDDTYTDLYGVRLSKLPGHEKDTFAYMDYSVERPNENDIVYAAGFPKEHYSFAEGVVKSSDYSMIVHTAFTDHGSSGGALIDSYGKVVGITDSGYDDVSSTAIPMKYVQLNIAGLK